MFYTNDDCVCFVRFVLIFLFRPSGGGDWSVLQPTEKCFEPMLPASESVAKREAVRAVVSNHDMIVKFCLRAAADPPNRGCNVFPPKSFKPPISGECV